MRSILRVSLRTSSSQRNANSIQHLKAWTYGHKTAILDQTGLHTFQDLLNHSNTLAKEMVKKAGCNLTGQRVAYLTDNDSMNVVVNWSAWINRSLAVPLCSSHPLAEKQYYIEDSQAKIIIGTEKYGEELTVLSKNSSAICIILPDKSESLPAAAEQVLDSERLSHVLPSDDALIIYTSGTTGRPKGVVLTHNNIQATVKDMIESWEWAESDVSLHTLPLHHIHGLINALHVPLSVGAQCVMLPRFDPAKVWEHLLDDKVRVSVMTAVPTIYAKLLEYIEKTTHNPEKIKQACQKIRLMISGSSALPLPMMKSWHELTGHTLLERYGMSEILMALTNPLYGARKPGTVGKPFPSVQTLIAQADPKADNGYINVTKQKSHIDPNCSESGELYIRGPTVFKEYWNKPEATRDTFTSDGWFKTGDTVCLDGDGYYKILGRTSVDIIKSGGYKISALDIESKILQHPHITECAVLGVPDDVYGQIVGCLVVLNSSKGSISKEELIKWCSKLMPKYHVPKIVKYVDNIPKNAMGKVNKKTLISLLHETE